MTGPPGKRTGLQAFNTLADAISEYMVKIVKIPYICYWSVHYEIALVQEGYTEKVNYEIKIKSMNSSRVRTAVAVTWEGVGGEEVWYRGTVV